MKSMGRLFHAVRAALVGIVLIGVAPACFGHGEGPPRPPTPPPAAAYGQDLVRERVHPPRWSWIHWWEANRDPYLKSLKQTTALQKTDPKVLAEYRARAVKALVAGLAAPSGDVRAASALALARMNERAALKSIANMAAGDGDPRVAMAALTALGLLDCPEAREALLTQVYASDPLLEAGCVGLGFLRAVDDPKVDAALQQTVAGTKPGPATVSAWALRRHTDAASAQLMQSLLAQSKSPWLASEAILVANPAAQVERVDELAAIDTMLSSVIAARGQKYVMMNAPGLKLAELTGILPGLNSPSVIPLAHDGMIAIHAVVEADAVWGLLPRLKAAGASGILVLPIEKIVA